jgi:hypothetical protein
MLPPRTLTLPLPPVYRDGPLDLLLAHRALSIRLLRHTARRWGWWSLRSREFPRSLAEERTPLLPPPQHSGRAMPDARSTSSRACNITPPRDVREKRQIPLRASESRR